MSDFNSIEPYWGTNIGGSSRIYFVSLSSVDASSFPSRHPSSANLSGNISLLPGGTWYSIKCIIESISSDDSFSLSQQGPSYLHSLSGIIKSDDKNIAALFGEMTHQRFLALRRDANGHLCLMGTLHSPLSFTFKKRTGARATDLKGFEFSFSAACPKPELYYSGTITPVSDLSYVYPGDNIGGSTRIYYVPVSQVSGSVFPKILPGTLSLSGDIILIEPFEWLYLTCNRESIQAEVPGHRDSDGALYEHLVGGFIRSDNANISWLFQKMSYSRFLVLRKDANGHMCLCGTPREPLSFSFKKRTGTKASDLKGYDFNFSGKCTRPELYYTGALAVGNDNNYVENGYVERGYVS